MNEIDYRAANEEVQAAYSTTFSSPQGMRVVADLIAFCFGRKSTFDPDDRVHARNEGRRDVLMRIAEFTHLSLEEIYQLRGIGRVKTTGENT